VGGCIEGWGDAAQRAAVFVSADALPRRRQPFARPKPITLAQVAIACAYTEATLGSTLPLLSCNT